VAEPTATPDPTEYAQGQLSRIRIEQLRLRPVKGNFDAAHLKEINRQIFQDFPKNGFNDVTPGEFRAPIEGALNAYVKGRRLESVKGVFPVAYSRMADDAQALLAATLDRANPEKLAPLNKAEFVKEMTAIYSALDYVHPFPEGNSRTLREFTRTVAKESGYTLAWEKIGATANQHDQLYIARDRAVFQHAKDHVNERLLVHISSATLLLNGNPSLETLIEKATRPTRALAFETQTQHNAISAHPELEETYKSLDLIKTGLKGVKPTEVDKYLTQARKALQERLNAGEVPKLAARNLTLVKPEREPTKDALPPKGRER
jgi:cell filamentation protein